MSNELQIPISNSISEPKVFTQTGDGNIQTNGINNLNVSQILITQPITPSTTHAKLLTSPTKDYYNLFVIEDDLPCTFSPFASMSFHISKDLALTEYIDEEDKKKFSCLDSQAIVNIMRFPSVIAKINTIPGQSDNQQNAFYGRVLDLTILESSIKVEILLTVAIPQMLLNQIASELRILYRRYYNELDIAHWTIKPVNLIDVLGKHGLNVVQTI